MRDQVPGFESPPPSGRAIPGPWEAFVTLELGPEHEAKWKAADALANIPGKSDEKAAMACLESAAREWGFDLVRISFISEYKPSFDILKDLGCTGTLPQCLRERDEEAQAIAKVAEATGKVQFCSFEPFIFADGEILIEKSGGMEDVESAAQKAAKRLGSSCVEPEHLLLGIIASDEVHLVFDWFHVDVCQLKKRLEQTIARRDPSETPPGDLALSPAAERAMKIAEEIAASMRCYYWDSDHLLLALIRDQDSLAGRLLQEVGTSFSATREVVWKLLDCRTFEEVMRNPWDRAT